MVLKILKNPTVSFKGDVKRKFQFSRPLPIRFYIFIDLKKSISSLFHCVEKTNLEHSKYKSCTL